MNNKAKIILSVALLLFLALIIVIVVIFLKPKKPVTPTTPTKIDEEQIEKNKQKVFNDIIDSTAKVDKDLDGLSDKEEAEYGTNPEKIDTDNDGLLDGDEINRYKTNPLKADTDGDGFLDGVEIRNGYNPKGTGKLN